MSGKKKVQVIQEWCSVIGIDMGFGGNGMSAGDVGMLVGQKRESNRVFQS